MIKLNKSSILAKVKVGTSAGEFAAREMEAFGLRDKNTTQTEQNIYTAIILAVPVLIVGSVLYAFAKMA